MLKRLLSAVTAAVLFVTMPVVSLAAERYEILQVGDEDAWVMELQEKLHEEGYLKVTPTGYYGTNTQNAVISYQRDHGLSVDGKAGPLTRKSILGDDYQEITESRLTGAASATPVPSASASADSEAAGEPEATAAPNPTDAPEPEPSQAPEPTESAAASESSSSASLGAADTLQLGDKGEAITELQEILREYEYYDYGSLTGYFGPVTKDAVIRFQRTYGLAEDGIVGPAVRAILESGNLQYYTMREGDRGDDVKELQAELKKLGYLTGTITGYYGDVTKRAVEQFQSNNGLSVDGTAGKETRRVLFGDDASGATEPVTTATSTPDPDEAGAESSGAEDPSGGVQAQASEEGTPVPSKDPASDDKPGESSSKLEKFLSVAESRVGKSYVYGAVGPNSFDCSGFVYYALKGAGVGVSRLSSAGYCSYSGWKKITSKSDLKAGDLVFFRSDSSSSISHVGIYLGGGNFIHAAPSLHGVGYSTMSSGYYSRNFVSARRVFS